MKPENKPIEDEEELDDRNGDVLVLIGGIILVLALVGMVVMLTLALIPR